MYKIQEAARIACVSVRTLRHYDQIGLLVPTKAENGYRLYSEADMDALQSILYFRYLGFPLGEIRGLLNAAEGDSLGMLRWQLGLLEQERERIDELIGTLTRTIRNQMGEEHMTARDKFKGFDWEDGRKKYDADARKLYGDKVIDDSYARQAGHEGEAAEEFN